MDNEPNLVPILQSSLAAERQLRERIQVGLLDWKDEELEALREAEKAGKPKDAAKAEHKRIINRINTILWGGRLENR